jgi:hypothetical protein
MNRQYKGRIAHEATYVRIFEGDRMLSGAEVSQVIESQEALITILKHHITELASSSVSDIVSNECSWAGVIVRGDIL